MGIGSISKRYKKEMEKKESGKNAGIHTGRIGNKRSVILQKNFNKSIPYSKEKQSFGNVRVFRNIRYKVKNICRLRVP